MKDLSPIEAGRWLDAVPQAVQDAVTSPATQQVIEQLGKQFTLHVDVVGLLVKLTSYMLVGYIGPEESFRELRASGVVDQQARQILDEINNKIFIPLRERMMKSSEEKAAQPAKQVTVRQVVPPSVPQPAQESPSNVAQPASHFHLQNKIAPPMRSMAARPISVPAPFPVQAPAQQMPASKLLEDHEEPHIEFAKVPAPSPSPVRTPVAPQMPLRPAGISNTGPASAFTKGSEPPANLPGTMPSSVIPPGGRPSFLVPPKMQSPAPELPKQAATIASQRSATPRTFERAPMPPATPTAPTPVAPKTPPPAPKPYTVDPYREPIDRS